MSIFSEQAEGPGKEYFLVNSDQLRQLVIDFSPDIKRDVNRMEDLIHEIVQTEREKAGLDKPDGRATLELNQAKHRDSDCDYQGRMRIAGRMYTARAWVAQGAAFINVTFEQIL